MAWPNTEPARAIANSIWISLMVLQRRFALAVASFVLAATLLAPADGARAQGSELSQLRGDIARLERQITDLRRQMAKAGSRTSGPASIGGELPPTLAARMEVRLNQLERQARGITGKLEEVGFAVRKLKEKLDRAVSDMELRLSALERGKPLAATSKPAAARRKPPAAGDRTPAVSASASSGAQIAKLPKGKPAEQYRYARGFLLSGNYDKAAAALKAFLAAHPKDALAGNAIYWLGETYYARKQYSEAAIHFAQGFKKYPKSQKAPDNLLKLGMSFAKLGKRAEACASLFALRKRYPRAANYIRRAARGEARRLRCS
ncbi:MAG: tol-pal system protein YbgF [Alphaproteobacteria bacterium]